MVLYNVLAWPEMKSKMEKQRIADKKTEIQRAMLIVNDLNILMRFVSMLMQMMQDLASKASKEDRKALEESLPYGDSIVEVFKIDTKQSLFKTKLRITKKDIGEGKPTDYEGLNVSSAVVELTKVFVGTNSPTIAFNWKADPKEPVKRYSFMEDPK